MRLEMASPTAATIAMQVGAARVIVESAVVIPRRERDVGPHDAVLNAGWSSSKQSPVVRSTRRTSTT